MCIDFTHDSGEPFTEDQPRGRPKTSNTTRVSKDLGKLYY
jgi:hypothetical protein